MAPIRVLIVDDSVVVRKVLSDGLKVDPEIEVAGTAADGSIALAKIPLLNPDLITLDIEMPVMTGLQTLVEIRKLYPKLPVIMFSTLTERGASITLDALALGASDYATKPQNTGGLEATLSLIVRELVPKIKGLCQRGKTKEEEAKSASITQGVTLAPSKAKGLLSPSRIDVVAIGTSTGGPNALAVVLPAIPRDFPVPIVIVQHMPPLFTRMLAERLQKLSAITVREGKLGEELKAGEAWIAPGDFHMKVTRKKETAKLEFSQDPPENACRPAVDVLFRSVASAYGANALAVVLTGMGSDGVRGAQQLKQVGAQVIVQDEESSVVWGMPGQVAAAGFADAIYPLESIASQVDRRVRNLRYLAEKPRSAESMPQEVAKSRA
jgi:two-component system, chemotaxis family, protein-glutamate methylesterase/glutaminase